MAEVRHVTTPPPSAQPPNLIRPCRRPRLSPLDRFALRLAEGAGMLSHPPPRNSLPSFREAGRTPRKLSVNLLPPHPPRGPAPGPRALARAGPAPSPTQRSCGGARVPPNPPPSGSGGDARFLPPPRCRCQPPSGDSICSQIGLVAAKSGRERCPRPVDWCPPGQAPSPSLAGFGGDILVAGDHGGIRAPSP